MGLILTDHCCDIFYNLFIRQMIGTEKLLYKMCIRDSLSFCIRNTVGFYSGWKVCLFLCLYTGSGKQCPVSYRSDDGII